MRREKQYLLEGIKEQIKTHGNTFVVMRYEKVPANTANQFRRAVLSVGGDVEVMRKRILTKACQEAGIELPLDYLTGHIGVVFSGKDPVETTKLVFQFSQDNGKAIQVACGHIDGKVYNAEDVEAFSKLPGKDEMRAQLLATLVAPMSETLAVVDALLTSVVHCLDNKAKGEGEKN